MRFAVFALTLLAACDRSERGVPSDPTRATDGALPAADGSSDIDVEVSLTSGIDPADEGTARLTWRFRTPVAHGLMLLAPRMPASLDVAPIVRLEELRGDAFRLERAPPGLHTVFVRGWRTRWHQLPVYIREDETTDLGTIELEPFPSEDMVEGIVRDVRGEPLAGVEICEIVQESGYAIVSTIGLTLANLPDGRFLGCPADTSRGFEVRKTGFDGTSFGARRGEPVNAVLLRSDERIVPIEGLRAAPIASGNERGTTVLIGMLTHPVSHGRLVLARGWVQTLEGASIAFAEDIAGGLFRFEDVPAGTYTVFLRGWRTRWHRELLPLHDGKLTELGPIELALVPSEDFLEGTVRDERGDPLPGVRIEYGPVVEGSADAGDVLGTTTLSREDGSFLVIPPESPARLRFRKDGFASQEVEGRSDRLLDVVLRRDS